ncbi:MAG: hypothetical protein EOO34_00790 [Cyanobacteriota bacterium]|nr:MAG: hypothetical protein EOO34_00790 [Cyanobacteriota bacterium]
MTCEALTNLLGKIAYLTNLRFISQASNLNKPSVCQATKKEFLILISRRDVSKALTFSKKMSKGQDLLPVCFRFVRC